MAQNSNVSNLLGRTKKKDRVYFVGQSINSFCLSTLPFHVFQSKF